jgi:hypothetical protein
MQAAFEKSVARLKKAQVNDKVKKQILTKGGWLKDFDSTGTARKKPPKP